MGVNYNSSIVTNGLVLCLDAANIKSYSGSGTIWNDLSVSKNIGTLVNSPTYSNGTLILNGSSQYITVASSSAWAFGGNGTVEQWVYINGNNGSNNRLWDVTNNASALDAYLNGATYNVWFHGNTVGVTNTIPANQWVNLVVTYTSGTISVYFNGVSQPLTGTTTGYNITNNGTLYIGQFSGGGNYYLNGSIPIMKIYNRPLSSDEILQNFNAVRGRYNI
jgi:hypothetical protein